MIKTYAVGSVFLATVAAWTGQHLLSDPWPVRDPDITDAPRLEFVGEKVTAGPAILKVHSKRNQHSCRQRAIEAVLVTTRMEGQQYFRVQVPLRTPDVDILAGPAAPRTDYLLVQVPQVEAGQWLLCGTLTYQCGPIFLSSSSVSLRCSAVNISKSSS